MEAMGDDSEDREYMCDSFKVIDDGILDGEHN